MCGSREHQEFVGKGEVPLGTQQTEDCPTGCRNLGAQILPQGHQRSVDKGITSPPALCAGEAPDMRN